MANPTPQTAPPTAPIQRERNPQQELKALLEKNRDALAKMLPDPTRVDRIIKVVLSATARDPKILRCDLQSILRSVMQACELDLEIGGLFGEAYLVPFTKWFMEDGRWKSVLLCQCIVGYKGYITLAMRSGIVKDIRARLVFERDVFDIVYGTDERIIHRPYIPPPPPNPLPAAGMPECDSPGPILGCYFVVEYANGGRHYEWMTAAEINAIRDRKKEQNEKNRKKDSKPPEPTPWDTDYGEMCKKTLVRRGQKYMPKTKDMRTAYELEAEVEEAERVVLDTELISATGAAAPAQRAKTLAAGIRSRLQPQSGESTEPVSAEKPAAAQQAPSPPPTAAEVLGDDEFPPEWDSADAGP
jgi:recombination protein RecT